MYVQFEEFILVELHALLYKVELTCIGKYSGFYTIATMEEKAWECFYNTIDNIGWIELQLQEKVSSGHLELWNIISLFLSQFSAYRC